VFTGLVQTVGEVIAAADREGGRRLLVRAPGWPHDPAPGESISVSGCCLTLASGEEDGAGTLAFDVVAETLEKTTLGRLTPGSRVNLERSATATTLLGGHIVQGHVDGVGEVVAAQRDPADWRVTIRLPSALMDFIPPKGSVAVDGVSLTVAAVSRDAFDVALVPTTLAETTLEALDVGRACNIETDILAKTVVHWLSRRESDRGGLRGNGRTAGS